MPNPKSGTVTMDVAKAVKDVKSGKIDFKVDKAGIIHTSIGKVNFTPEQIYQNAKNLLLLLSNLSLLLLKVHISRVSLFQAQ